MSSWEKISPFAGAAVMPRLALLTLSILILGVPINDFWRFLLLTIAVMVVCFGNVRLEPLRWLVVLAIALTVYICYRFAEAHDRAVGKRRHQRCRAPVRLHPFVYRHPDPADRLQRPRSPATLRRVLAQFP